MLEFHTEIELRQADSFEHWLVMYLLGNLFWIILNPKKLWTGALNNVEQDVNLDIII